MPALDTLRINEIFWSFQGEGCRLGRSSLFLRLSGCTLRCPYCDTPESWQNEGSVMTIDEIVGEVDSLRRVHPDSQLVITGGEPLEQDLGPLLKHVRSGGMFIAIETNGTGFQELPIDWWAVSPKRESDYFIHPQLRDRIDEVKLVVTENLNLDVIRSVRNMVQEAPIFLQPDVYNQGDAAYDVTFALFEQAVSERVPNLRVGIQLHRVYGVR